jgi:hypothetical protein
VPVEADRREAVCCEARRSSALQGKVLDDTGGTDAPLHAPAPEALGRAGLAARAEETDRVLREAGIRR